MTQPPQNPGPGNQPWNGDPNLNPQQPQNPGQFPQSQPSDGQGYGPQGGAPYGQGAPGDPYAQGAPADPYAQQAAGQPHGATQAFPETPKKGGGLKNIGGIILAALLVIGGGWAIWNNMVKEAALEPGKCVVMTGKSPTNVDHDEVSCDTKDKFTYKVAEVFDGEGSCTDQYASSYTMSTERRGNTTVNKTVCLIPNLFEGSCYKEGAPPNDFDVADCGSAELKVLKVIKEAGATCDAPSEPLTYTKPENVTYCLEFQQ